MVQQPKERDTASPLAKLFFCGIPVLLIALMILGMLSAILRYPEGSYISCLSKVKQVDLGIQMYIQDYDERLPASASWNEDLRPYLGGHDKSLIESLLRCPQEPNQKVPSYAYNGRLQKCLSEKLKSPESIVLLFDSIPGKNLAGGRELLPNPPRHDGLYTIGLLDGHAKAYNVNGLASLIWKPSIFAKKH